MQLRDRLEALDDSIQVAGIAKVLDAHWQLQLKENKLVKHYINKSFFNQI